MVLLHELRWISSGRGVLGLLEMLLIKWESLCKLVVQHFKILRVLSFSFGEKWKLRFCLLSGLIYRDGWWDCPWIRRRELGAGEETWLECNYTWNWVYGFVVVSSSLLHTLEDERGFGMARNKGKWKFMSMGPLPISLSLTYLTSESMWFLLGHSFWC